VTAFQALDKALRAAGWRYDAGDEDFFDEGDKQLSYREGLALVPCMTLEELAGYQDGGFCASRMGRTAKKKGAKKVTRRSFKRARASIRPLELPLISRHCLRQKGF
jgi:hypothetical protein